MKKQGVRMGWPALRWPWWRRVMLDLSGLPEGYGFQFEMKLTGTTENKSKPVLDKVVVSFGK